MTIENLQIVKSINSKTYQQVARFINYSYDFIASSKSKNEIFNIEYILENRSYYLYSKYNPEIEINRILEKEVKGSKTPYFLFIGIGTGLQIKKALESFPDAHYTIVEPKIELLVAYFQFKDTYKFNWRNCDDLIIDWGDLENKSDLINQFNNDMTQIILPTYKQLFKKDIEVLYEKIKSDLENTVNELSVNSHFQKRWTINSIKNSNAVLKTTNFLENARPILNNQPVLLVSAGPSLTQDIELIRKIKNEGRAYIIAVGSAGVALIEEGIIPDLLFSYDPKEQNQMITQKIKNRNLEIPLIFGSTIGYETIENYPGAMSHFITSQDLYGQYVFETPSYEIIQDAPSIAVITINILLHLNCSPIILAGQNLGFVDNKRYAKSVKYTDSPEDSIVETTSTMIKTLDVSGNLINTDKTFEQMKMAMENTIAYYNLDTPIINTTKNGAAIKGTVYKPLEEVMETYLLEKNKVSKEKLKSIFLNNIVNKTYNSNNAKLVKDLEILKIYFEKIENCIKKILTIYDTRVFTKLNKAFIDFDRAFNRILDNKAYIIFIFPMCRNQASFFVTNKTKVMEIKQPIKKVEKFIEVYVPYFKILQKAFNEVYELIDDIKK